ncbi:MAG: hypothetical protein QJR12_03930 [Mycobacterium sp.]|uniref:hypothetical protein n=1 Tax=Mycobacterium sp. TaxID=1785 RepID=UPI0026308BFB|nr:hypothetical protein [Mycobacterium sp.]MDI3313450.1 hypothetical protein [Mycobacterium sp.]
MTVDTATAFGHSAAMDPLSARNVEGIGNPFAGLWNGAREVLPTMSYYEMKNRAGALAGSGDRVDGPLLATFSSADRALGWWYPAASILANQDSESATDSVYRRGPWATTDISRTRPCSASCCRPPASPMASSAELFMTSMPMA